MAVLKMKRLQMLVPQSDRDRVIEDLAWMGCVQPVDIQPRADDPEWQGLMSRDEVAAELFDLDQAASMVHFAIDGLAQYDVRKKGLLVKKPYMTRGQISQAFDQREMAMRGAEVINDKLRQRLALKSERQRLEALVSTLRPWELLGVPLGMEYTREVGMACFTVPLTVDLNLVEGKVADIVSEFLIHEVSTDEVQRYVFVLFFRDFEDIIAKELKAFAFNRVNFKDVSGVAVDEMRAAHARMADIDQAVFALEEELKGHSQALSELELMYDSIRCRMEGLKTRALLLRTESVAMLEAWVPERAESRVADFMEGAGAAYEFTDPLEADEPPVLLQNNRVVAPYESVTEMYSAPNYREIDPNPVLAPFYFVFFGMMLGDAGYGLLISLACALGLRLMRPKRTMKKMLQLLFQCGIATMIAGFFFGSFFGDSINKVIAMFGGTWEWKAIFNPMAAENIMPLLIICIALGFVHIIAGLVIKGYACIKAGKPLDALFDAGSWIILLFGFLFIALPMAGLPGALGTVGTVMILVGIAMLLLTQGRHSKKVMGKITGGLASLYDIISYMSDLISYSRIMALALASGAIASVFNELATMGGPNPIGLLMFLVIFAIGHLFNLGINALGAYVHAARLQFVEFFGKFYEGGGELFAPLSFETKFVDINYEEDK